MRRWAARSLRWCAGRLHGVALAGPPAVLCGRLGGLMKTIHGIPDEVLKDLMKFQTEKGWSIPMLLCALVVMDAISNGGSLSRAKKRARAIAKGVITRPGFVEKLASLASAPDSPVN